MIKINACLVSSAIFLINIIKVNFTIFWTQFICLTVDKDGVVNRKDVMILYQGRVMPYEIYQTMTASSDQEEVEQFAKIVGKSVAKEILLYRN